MADDVRQEIEETNKEFTARFAQGDHAGVAELYTEDALFLPTGKPVARGREQIRETFASYAEAGITDVRFDTIEVEERGETVLELARSTVFKGEELIRESLYVIAWRRDDDGVLRLHWDVVSTSHER
jgi:uncharacterized protein (TIGR02246 family)